MERTRVAALVDVNLLQVHSIIIVAFYKSKTTHIEVVCGGRQSFMLEFTSHAWVSSAESSTG